MSSAADSFTILLSLEELERAIMQVITLKVHTKFNVRSFLIKALPEEEGMEEKYEKLSAELYNKYQVWGDTSKFTDIINVPKQFYCKNTITYERAFNYVVQNLCSNERNNLILDANFLAYSALKLSNQYSINNRSSIEGLAITTEKYTYIWPRLVLAHDHSNVYELDARSAKIKGCQLKPGGLFYVYFKNNPKVYANYWRSMDINRSTHDLPMFLGNEMSNSFPSGITIKNIGAFWYFNPEENNNKTQKDYFWKKLFNYYTDEPKKKEKANKKSTSKYSINESQFYVDRLENIEPIRFELSADRTD